MTDRPPEPGSPRITPPPGCGGALRVPVRRPVEEPLFLASARLVSSEAGSSLVSAWGAVLTRHGHPTKRNRRNCKTGRPNRAWFRTIHRPESGSATARPRESSRLRIWNRISCPLESQRRNRCRWASVTLGQAFPRAPPHVVQKRVSSRFRCPHSPQVVLIDLRLLWLIERDCTGTGSFLGIRCLNTLSDYQDETQQAIVIQGPVFPSSVTSTATA